MRELKKKLISTALLSFHKQYSKVQINLPDIQNINNVSYRSTILASDGAIETVGD